MKEGMCTSFEFAFLINELAEKVIVKFWWKMLSVPKKYVEMNIDERTHGSVFEAILISA